MQFSQQKERMKAQGFGCMGFSAFYKSSRSGDETRCIDVFHHASNNGVSLFNSATFYGPLNEEGYGSNLRLIRKCIEGLDRSKVQLMVKIGMDTRAPAEKTGQVWNNRADPEGLRVDLNYALEQLGVDFIDIVVLCRVSPTVPIEESVAALKSFVDEGKARHIGLSEASPETIRRAQAVTPLYCIEQEWSLWSRDIEEEIVPLCRDLDIKIVAYSPLGRGFLTGKITRRDDPDVFDTHDYRLIGLPRFSEENFDRNLALVHAVTAIAERKGVTTGQIALAWLYAQADSYKTEDKSLEVIPIPGTCTISHLDENLAARSLVLSAEELAEINMIFDPSQVAGSRYAHMAMTFHGNK